VQRLKPLAVIIDIDGTLADVHGISHHIRKVPGHKHKDFSEFHKRSPHVEPKQQALDYINDALEAGMVLIVLTARREQWLKESKQFVDRVIQVPYELHMRPDDDFGNDIQFKKHQLKYLRRHYDVRGAIEDNPQVAAMFESAGVPVELVPDGRWADLEEIVQ